MQWIILIQQQLNPISPSKRLSDCSSEREVDICKPESEISDMDGTALFVVQFYASHNVVMQPAYNRCGATSSSFPEMDSIRLILASTLHPRSLEDLSVP